MLPHHQIDTIFDQRTLYLLEKPHLSELVYRQPTLPLWRNCHVWKEVLMPDCDMNNPVLRFSSTNGETIHHHMMSLQAALNSYASVMRFLKASTTFLNETKISTTMSSS